MTDNRTTELRRLLDERGIKYFKRDVGSYRKTSWGKRGSDLVVFIESGIGTPLRETYMTMKNPTAEQTIAATLGNGTCKQMLTDCDDGLMPPFIAHCSACDAKWGFTPNFCPNCGRKVVSA